MIDEEHDSLFDEESLQAEELAHIDFNLLETHGRWFLKVLSGPNTGAEFSMQKSSSYLIGTDTRSCDIIFKDLSVSRQHAKITIDNKERVFIEDLNSKNGTYIDGEKLLTPKDVSSNALVSMGTTTFMLIDREGDRQTIVSPSLSVGEYEERKTSPEEKVQKASLEALQHATMPPVQAAIEQVKQEELKQKRQSQTVTALAVLSIITILLVVVGVGTTMLFKPQDVAPIELQNKEVLIAKELKEYPEIQFSFNESNGRLLLVGHVLTAVDRSKILDSLQRLKFINSIDSTNIVIDEFVWREINQVLSKNTAWRGITITSPQPGKFLMTGFLDTRKEAESLYDYISRNFPYVNLLERKVIIQEELRETIRTMLNGAGFQSVTFTLSDGSLQLSGTIAHGTSSLFTKTVGQIKQLAGVRNVQSNVREVAPEETLINISDKYAVTGLSQLRGKMTVVINGKILMEGDSIDGMAITSIEPHAVLLEKNGVKYRIDFNLQ